LGDDAKTAPSDDQHLTNAFAALALGLDDRIRGSVEEAAGHSAAAPSALVALHEFLQAIGLSPSGAVRLVDRLVADGYVQRQSAADARSVALVLTRSGRSIAAKVQGARATVVAEMLEALSRDERRFLSEVTDKLLVAITERRLADRDQGFPVGAWLCRLCDLNACGRPEGKCPAATSAQAHFT
jgi:MarR family transcriptional repressor of emrRAB